MKLDNLATALAIKTNQDKLAWTMNGSSQVTLREGHSLIEINEIAPNNTYQLIIRNKDGIVLDSAFFYEGSSAQSIFNYTKRKTLRVDEELAEIMKRITEK